MRLGVCGCATFGGWLCIAAPVAAQQPPATQPSPYAPLPQGAGATTPSPYAPPPAATPPPYSPPPPGPSPYGPPPAAAYPSAPRADQLPPGPPPGGVPVELISEEAGVGFEVYEEGKRPGSSRPLVSCRRDCRVHLVPGTYVFYVMPTEETLGGTRTLDIDGPTRIRFDPDMTAHRTAGLVMGIAGPILLVISVVTLIGESIDSGRDDETLPAVGALAGLTMTPVGWVMFGTSYKPEYEMEFPDEATAPEARAFRGLEAASGPGGRPRMLGLRFSF